MIRRPRRYARSEIQANPGTLYVFGDNVQRKGFGGQAKEARGECNAVGVVTKMAPTNDPNGFLSDADLPYVKPMIQDAFRRLSDHLKAGGDIVYPQDGIGTGLADLSRRAPKVAALIARCERHLGLDA